MNEESIYITVEFKCRTVTERHDLWAKLMAEHDFLVDGEARGPFISAVQGGKIGGSNETI